MSLMKLKFVLLTCSITCLFYFMDAKQVSARGHFLPFGGLVSYTVACTCPGSIGNLWILFTPMWFGQIPVTGSLVYVPYTSRLYSWYKIGVSGTYHLGSYEPGVQACWMTLPTIPPTCAPLVSAGVITKVGTSF